MSYVHQLKAVKANLVGVNHQNGAGRSSILADEGLGGGSRATGALLWIINDGANESKTTAVVLNTSTDLDLEVVETALWEIGE